MASFIERSGASADEAQAMATFVRRLEIDPFDVRAQRDQTGEFYALLRSTAEGAVRSLGVGYRINPDLRTVDVIAFEAY